MSLSKEKKHLVNLWPFYLYLKTVIYVVDGLVNGFLRYFPPPSTSYFSVSPTRDDILLDLW